MKLLVLIPSYNSGAELLTRTVQAALKHWPDVWVVIDGSRDDSTAAVRCLAAGQPHLRVLELATNQGKGAAVLHGARLAQVAGFTHLLTMDADGQHPADFIPRFADLAAAHGGAAVFGAPVFGPEAPALRIQGRKVSNGWAALETLGWGLGDSLFGMRVYPLKALLRAAASTRWARRFDFDPEMAVRLAWAGVPIAVLPTPVRYLTSAEGGVSQFRYMRDNLLLTWMHMRLCCGFLLRLPQLLWRLAAGGNPGKTSLTEGTPDR
ncbi:MAG: glycosyltransferase family 2 protein [Verrucomicrobia bacterium]|nr:glycosyltransferase family 2 protein [Verrucomicrobiota bacterium]